MFGTEKSQMENMVSYVLMCGGCFLILSYVVKILKELWWKPIRIQSTMRLQGIKGPSYKFFHGNNKDVLSMGIKAKANSITHLSHHQVFPTVLPHIHAWKNLYGMKFLSWRGTQAQLTITEVELVKGILSNKDGMFQKRKADAFLRKLIGDGIITSRGEKWHKLRKLSNHAFYADSLKGMIPAMVESVGMMLERWSQNYEGHEFEVSKEFKVLTSEIISRTAFGSSYLEGQHIFDMLIQLAPIIYKNKLNITIPGFRHIRNLVKTKDDKESDKIEEEMRKCLMNMIHKREELAMMKESESYGSDFLGLLVKAHHENDKSKKLSVDELIDECKSFYVAGHETSASSLTWTLLLLAIHTDWQNKAREEVLHLLGTNNPCPLTLPKFKILNMIINEALRLYPPVNLLTREAKEQVKLGEIVIPKNMHVEIPILALHYNPDIWGKDVYEFKPERFAEGIAKATSNNNGAVYLPFGLGARSCVGSNFAMTEMKIALSMILQRYSFELSPAYVHSPFIYLTLSPQYGVQIILHRL